MPHPLQLEQPRREFKNYSGNALNIHPSAQTRLLVTSICLIHLGGKRFADDEEVEAEVRRWLRQQSKDFYTVGFNSLVKRWDKCINIGGGYVEK
jgi:hypothetical protein